MKGYIWIKEATNTSACVGANVTFPWKHNATYPDSLEGVTILQDDTKQYMTYKNNTLKPIQQNVTAYDNAGMVIHNVQEHHTGKYTCTIYLHGDISIPSVAYLTVTGE